MLSLIVSRSILYSYFEKKVTALVSKIIPSEVKTSQKVLKLLKNENITIKKFLT